MKLKTTLALVGSIVAGSYVTPAVAADASALSLGGDIGIYNQYVVRGVTMTNRKGAIQGDVALSVAGLTASTWFSNAYPSPQPQFTPNDTIEFDFALDYSGEAGNIGYSAGWVTYAYLYDAPSNFSEVYASLAYHNDILTPFTKIYYTAKASDNKAYESGDTWIDIGVSTMTPYDIEVMGMLSYSRIKQSNSRTRLNPTAIYKSGFNLATVGISNTTTHGATPITLSLTGTLPTAQTQADGSRYILGFKANTEFVAGLSLGF
ncbi:MAG: hypothetical protein HQM07_01520 [Zetaproteobacteria bacterium]|nr:hypothetical protein [Zetaproteobacteria bacterium]